MAEIATLTVRRHSEEAIRGGVFWERDPQHALVNPVECPVGDLFIADDDAHSVADTYAVRQAIKASRLVMVSENEPLIVTAQDVQATDAARLYALENGIDLVSVIPSAKNGVISLFDVRREARRRDEEP